MDPRPQPRTELVADPKIRQFVAMLKEHFHVTADYLDAEGQFTLYLRALDEPRAPALLMFNFRQTPEGWVPENLVTGMGLIDIFVHLWPGLGFAREHAIIPNVSDEEAARRYKELTSRGLRRGKHSLGPFEVGVRRPYVVAVTSDKPTAQTTVSRGEPTGGNGWPTIGTGVTSEEEMAANSQLFAAAPRMAQALRVAVEELLFDQWHGCTISGEPRMVDKALAFCQAALDEAIGTE